jgi:hypothetical protein
METAECLVSPACVLLLSGCASFQVAGQVQAGRQALLMNNPTQALTYLEQAVPTNPQYVYEAESFREGFGPTSGGLNTRRANFMTRGGHLDERWRCIRTTT